MRIIIDSREQRNLHILKVLNQLGIEWMVKKLDYGDYAFEVDGVSYENKISIERKLTLTELAGNLTKGRNRFDAEMCRAKADNCKMVLLIEDKKAREKMKLRIQMDRAGIDDKTKHRKTWRSNFSGNSMVGSIKAFKDRYDLDLVFCSKVRTAKEIIRIFEDFLENERKVLK